ncbi:MAG TPA: mandelate racemase/muconate lactonizing enzyme family protein [Casimicrobiaceae bacterium]|nr:mandelate racemase/muconate lactonizing enzyme family protein [Casimicrobiaceae bacterium]
MQRTLSRLSLTVARITERTRWIFVEIACRDARVGAGEATLDGCEDTIVAAGARIAPRLWSIGTQGPEAFQRASVPATLADAALASAIDMALWDLHAQGTGVRLVDALGGAQRASVRLYANINRRTRDRSAAGFAQSARDASAAGFDALKIAPFDEVSPARCANGEGLKVMQSGLARIAAVREAVGPAARLMVDCHWRFDEATAASMIDAAAEPGVHWIECPLPETAESIPALVRLRGRANRHRVRLAGMEQGIGYDSFRPFCEAGCYDVMMPDVKYIGGLRQMLRCAEQLTRYGIEVSPHNPSGPIAHVASMHVSAAMQSFDMLELQFDESPLFDRLVGGVGPSRSGGSSALPQGIGLGVRLASDVLADCAEGPPLIVDAP